MANDKRISESGSEERKKLKVELISLLSANEKQVNYARAWKLINESNSPLLNPNDLRAPKNATLSAVFEKAILNKLDISGGDYKLLKLFSGAGITIANAYHIYLAGDNVEKNGILYEKFYSTLKEDCKLKHLEHAILDRFNEIGIPPLAVILIRVSEYQKANNSTLAAEWEKKLKFLILLYNLNHIDLYSHVGLSSVLTNAVSSKKYNIMAMFIQTGIHKTKDNKALFLTAAELNETQSLLFLDEIIFAYVPSIRANIDSYINAYDGKYGKKEGVARARCINLVLNGIPTPYIKKNKFLGLFLYVMLRNDKVKELGSFICGAFTDSHDTYLTPAQYEQYNDIRPQVENILCNYLLANGIKADQINALATVINPKINASINLTDHNSLSYSVKEITYSVFELLKEKKDSGDSYQEDQSDLEKTAKKGLIELLKHEPFPFDASMCKTLRIRLPYKDMHADMQLREAFDKITIDAIESNDSNKLNYFKFVGLHPLIITLGDIKRATDDNVRIEKIAIFTSLIKLGYNLSNNTVMKNTQLSSMINNAIEGNNFIILRLAFMAGIRKTNQGKPLFSKYIEFAINKVNSYKVDKDAEKRMRESKKTLDQTIILQYRADINIFFNEFVGSVRMNIKKYIDRKIGGKEGRSRAKCLFQLLMETPALDENSTQHIYLASVLRLVLFNTKMSVLAKFICNANVGFIYGKNIDDAIEQYSGDICDSDRKILINTIGSYLLVNKVDIEALDKYADEFNGHINQAHKTCNGDDEKIDKYVGKTLLPIITQFLQTEASEAPRPPIAFP